MPNSPESPDPLAAEIAARLAQGEHVVTRLVTMRWFTYAVDGEEVLVTDQMRATIEGMAGAPLVEYTPPQYQGMRALGFEPAVQPAVRERLFPNQGASTAAQRPVLEMKLHGERLLVVGNEAGMSLLGDMLAGRKAGTAYAERAIGSDGQPRAICVVCCELTAEVASVGPEDPQVRAALAELFTFYTVDAPLAESERFGLAWKGMTI